MELKEATNNILSKKKDELKKPSGSEGFFVRAEGLEPTHLAALDPKSSVSTNSTTPAKLKGKYKKYFVK